MFVLESNVFLTPRNLSNLLLQSTVVGIMALGLMFVLLVKEIDLSVAAINGVCSVLMAKLIVDYGVYPQYRSVKEKVMRLSADRGFGHRLG